MKADMPLNQETEMICYTISKKLRCPWGIGSCPKKWTRRYELKSWLRLIAFHIALIPFRKLRIQLFSFQLWANSRADWALLDQLPKQLVKEIKNFEFKPIK